MNTVANTTTVKTHSALAFARRFVERSVALFSRIPHDLIAWLARFSVAMTFWQSGQTKIEGLVLDPVSLMVQWGLPRLSDSAVELFRSEYMLPLLPPNLAALLAATAEHVFPVLLLLGLATRFSALALLVMTLVIEIFVYPGAFATHGVWAVSLLYLLAKGPGRFAMDNWIARRFGA